MRKAENNPASALAEPLSGARRTQLRVALVLLVFLVGFIDYITGYEFELVIFYFIPIAITAWTEKWHTVLLIAIVSGLVWYASDFFAGSQHTREFYRYWDGCMKIATFIIIGRAVHRTRTVMREKEEANRQLKKALEELQELREIVPICAYCKAIRNDQGYYEKVETYISRVTGQNLTHGICPACAQKIEG